MITQNETRRARRYQQMAKEMRRIARTFSNGETRVSMLAMAQAYQHIAETLASHAPDADLELRQLPHTASRRTHKIA